MSDQNTNYLIDGKPLNSLRVVDLKEELRKRGIRSSGTKSQLQQLLMTALDSSQIPINDHNISNTTNDSNEQITVPPITTNEANETSSINDPEQHSQQLDQSSEIVDSAKTDENSECDNKNQEENKSNDKTEKFASISINEEKETIKLTIRSSPRKQEQFFQQQESSESEESQSDDVNESDNDQNKTIPTESTKNAVSETIESETDKQTNIEQKLPAPVADEDEEVKSEEKPSENQTEAEKIEDSSNISRKEEQIDQKNHEESVEVDKNNDNIKISDDASATSSKSRTLIVKNRLSTQKSTEESNNSKTTHKKRRWGSSQTNESLSSSVLKKGISSDEIKQIINDSIIDNDQQLTPPAKVSKLSEDKPLQSKLDESQHLSSVNQQEPKEESNEIDVKKVDISFKKDQNSSTLTISNQKQSQELKENGNVIVSENQEEQSIKQPVSPAKNPESTVLFITGLVRPYTLMQLKKLLNTVGQIDEEKFWIDKIKSKCYATYSTIEEAVETRKNLHNLKWPQSSPKNLCVEFATLEDIDRCLNPKNYEDLPMKNIEKVTTPSIDNNNGKYDLIIKDNKTEKLNKLIDRSNDGVVASDATNRQQQRNVREWDRDKIAAIKNNRDDEKVRSKNEKESVSKKRENDQSPDHQQQNRYHHRENKLSKTTDKNDQRSDPPRHEEQQARSESPINSLEDLFKKTKTIPYIYWLPLSEEEAIERERIRIEMEKQRETRYVQQRYEMSSRRLSPPQSSHMPMARDMHRGRRNSPINFRRKPSISPVYRRNHPSSSSRHSRSPNNRRRYSPQRR